MIIVGKGLCKQHDSRQRLLFSEDKRRFHTVGSSRLRNGDNCFFSRFVLRKNVARMFCALKRDVSSSPLTILCLTAPGHCGG